MTEPIAIIGMGCRMPGAANPAAFWELLVRGHEAVGEPPPDRPELEPPAWLVGDAPTCTRGGFLDRLDLFEPSFFRISPREAARMDPQQRLLLEVAWEALEDAGQPVGALSGTNAGVFVGLMNADFARRHAQDLSQLDAQLGPGSSLGIASNRISFVLDLRGPSLTVDTLCSSSLVAIHLACQSLANDESTPVAIAGGVNVILDRTMDVFYARAGLLSADGRCRAFDASARGIVRGEGAGLVVLKRLARAQADGDRIHAVIRGSAVNQDGRSNGLTSPSRWSQEEVLRTAYRRAGVAPERVGYVEAHGTGTLIGDPIETAALGAVIGKGRSGPPCAIGSVKTNLGHLESAAGIAGLIKAVLSISHQTLAPSLHFEAPNPYAKLEERALFVPTRVQPWPAAADGSVLAGVSSFGMGGTNAHVVLAAIDPPAPRAKSAGRASLLPISAASVTALDAVQRHHAAQLRASAVELDDVLHSLGTRRDHYDLRRAIVATSAEEAAALLEHEAPFAGRIVPGRTHVLVFVFPDDPTHDLHAGRELAAEEPVFRAAFERAGGVSPVFAFQVALATWWRALGFEPHAVVGIGAGAKAADHVRGSLPMVDLAAALGEDSTIFIEISARPLLLAEMRSLLERTAAIGAALPSLVPGRSERAALLDTIAQLYCLGCAIDWKRLGAPDARFVPFGTYPWQRERAWLDLPSPRIEAPPAQDILVSHWERTERAAPPKHAAGEWLVISDEPETAIVRALERAGHRARLVAPPSTPDDWDRVLADGPRDDVVQLCGGAAQRQLASTVRLVQALARRDDVTPPRLWLVTRGAQVVAGDTSGAGLSHATLWGLGRVIANEHPRLCCTLVDLPATERSHDVEALAAELLADGDESEVAIRAPDRFVARLARQPLAPPPSPLRLRPDAAYVVTGGLGGLGLAVARRLVERGARQLVLVGRSGVTTDHARAVIAEMTALGARVVVERADVADRNALASLLDRHDVRGIVHAAGVMAPAMLAAVDPDHVTEVMTAKVDGALHLHELTSSRRLDFFTMYSSVATLLGTPGQGIYAAANAYLDALAEHRRAIGLPATSIAWTVIEDTGMAAHASARALRQLADRGIASITTDRATDVLEQLLAISHAPPQLGVVAFDHGRWSTFYPHAATCPRLSALGASQVTARAEPGPAAQKPGVFAAELQGLAGADRVRALEDYLCTITRAVLHHAGALEPTRSLQDLGIDSLTGLELQTMLAEELAIEVPTDRLLRGPTIRELAAEISALFAPDDEVAAPPQRNSLLAMRVDALLEPHVEFANVAHPAHVAPGSILLTGGTGFLGAYLVAELLAQTSARLHLLVRAPTADDGLRRLEDVLGRYGLAALDLRARVRCIPGDLGKPNLGLTARGFEELASSVDTIVHSGASVNFVFPYTALKAANVGGTREVLRLAAMARGMRVHYVSTIGVFPGGAGHLDTVFEDARSVEPERLQLGYMRAKWAAEELAMQAREHGLDTSIYRPGTISGHSITGAFNPDDFVCALIKGCVELGAAPGVEAPINLVPVDYVSRAIVGLALAEPRSSGQYHLVSRRAIAWTEIVQWLRDLGYPLVELPYLAWRTLLIERAEATGNALLPLLPLFHRHENTGWLALPPYDDARTERALVGTGIACPPIDAALFRRYVERFVVSGYLPRP